MKDNKKKKVRETHDWRQHVLSLHDFGRCKSAILGVFKVRFGSQTQTSPNWTVCLLQTE